MKKIMGQLFYLCMPPTAYSNFYTLFGIFTKFAMKKINPVPFYRAVLLGEVPAVSEARLSWPLTHTVNRCGSTPPTPLLIAS